MAAVRAFHPTCFSPSESPPGGMGTELCQDSWAGDRLQGSGNQQWSDRPYSTLPASVATGHCLGQRWPCHSSFSTHPRLLWSPEPLPGPAPSSVLLVGHWDRTELWANFLYSVVSPTSLNFFFSFSFSYPVLLKIFGSFPSVCV